MPSIITAIGGLTLAFNINRLAAKAMLAQDALGGFFALVRSSGVIAALASTASGVGKLALAFQTFRAATVGGSFVEILGLIATLPAVVAAGLIAVTAATAGILAYEYKVVGDTKAVYKQINADADEAQQKLFEKAKALRTLGPLGRLKAEQLLTISLRYNYQNSPEEDARLAAKLSSLKTQIAAQAQLDAAAKKSAQSAQDNIKPTEAQVVAYQALEDKLVAVSQKYGQDKLTPFQTGVAAARKEVDALSKSIQTALDKGQLSEKQGQGLQGQASALAARAISELTLRQLNEDGKVLRGHERDIQNGLTGLIDDARVKRQATLTQEIRDIGEKYAPQIKAALQNAQSAPTGQKSAFTREAGQLQQDQAREIVVAQQKANNDLDQLDRDRANKVRAAQQTLLGEQQKGLSARTALLVSEQAAAVTSAGDSAQAQLEATRRYAGLILAAKQQELQASSQAARLQAKTDLGNSLNDAQSAGAQQGALELAARQTYLQRLRNISDTQTNDLHAAQLASVKAEQTAEALVVTEGAKKQLSDVKALTGKGLDQLSATYQAGLLRAAKEGNVPVLDAYRKLIDQVKGYQQQALDSFRTAAAETEKVIRDLSIKLKDAQPKSEAQQGRDQAAQPFVDVFKSARDSLAKLNKEYSNLSQKAQTPALLARYVADTQHLEGIQTAAHVAAEAARLQADLVSNAKRLADSNAAQTGIRQGELTLADTRGKLAEKLAQSNAQQIAAKQNLITLATKSVQATEEELARLAANQAADLAAVPVQKTEERARLIAQQAQARLALQNTLVGKQGSLYDAVQARVQEILTVQQRSLTSEDAQNKLLEARTPLADRALLTAQLDVKSSQDALKNARDAAAQLLQAGAGRDQLAAAELAITNAQTGVLTAREKLETQITAEIAKRATTAQLELDLSQARQKLSQEISGASQDAIQTARFDLALTSENLAANRSKQQALAGQVGKQDELLKLQTEETGLLSTQVQQQRTLTQSVKDRALLLESIAASERSLGTASAATIQGAALATRTLAGAREDLALSERRYVAALADSQALQNQTTLGAYKTATDDLTAKLQAQRQAVQALADSYRTQINEMDGVRSATERLAALVRPDTGKIAQSDVSAELDKFRAIQGRRDSALANLQQAIQSGDAKRISTAEADLTAQEDRYRKQADRISKGTGIQLSLTNEGAITDTLKQLEQLGVTYDQLSPQLQAQADARDKEARSALTFSSATSIFAPAADRLSAALKQPLSFFSTNFSSSVPKLPPASAGMSNYRGGDTITYQIETNVYPSPGQQLGLDDVTRAVNRSIDERIGTAQRAKAWKAGC